MSPRDVSWRIGRVSAELVGASEPRERTDSTVLVSPAPDWDALLKAFRDGVGRPVLLDQNWASRIASVIVNAASLPAKNLLGNA